MSLLLATILILYLSNKLLDSAFRELDRLEQEIREEARKKACREALTYKHKGNRISYF